MSQSRGENYGNKNNVWRLGKMDEMDLEKQRTAGVKEDEDEKMYSYKCSEIQSKLQNG